MVKSCNIIFKSKWVYFFVPGGSVQLWWTKLHVLGLGRGGQNDMYRGRDQYTPGNPDGRGLDRWPSRTLTFKNTILLNNSNIIMAKNFKDPAKKSNVFRYSDRGRRTRVWGPGRQGRGKFFFLVQANFKATFRT